MAETTELDAFLGEPAAPVAAEPEPQVESTPEPQADAGGKGDKPPEATTEADDAEPPEPQAGEPVVPRKALEAERHARQDWKRQAIEAQTQRDELRKQLEEAKRAASAPPPQPAPQPQPVQIPNPAVDPQGYHQWQESQRLHDELNQRLNFSEMLVTKELGAEKVEALKAEFLEAAKANPSLRDQLKTQPHPYEWVAKQVEIIRAQREIGDDPAAFRERIRQEAIAEFQKANTPTPPPVSPAAGMAPSLATARSVAGRSSPVWTGPESLDDIVRSIHRK